MNKSSIVLINGKKQSGKDTTANYLCSKYGYTKLSFAGALKEQSLVILRDCFGIKGIELSDFENEDFKNTKIGSQFNTNGCTYRKFLQWYGTEFCRTLFSSTIWPEMLVSRLNLGKDYVISDFRFPNEFEYIAKNTVDTFDITTIRVDRYTPETPESQHISETALKDFDFNYEVDNSSTLDSLYEKINYIYRNLK